MILQGRVCGGCIGLMERLNVPAARCQLHSYRKFRGLGISLMGDCHSLVDIVGIPSYTSCQQSSMRKRGAGLTLVLPVSLVLVDNFFHYIGHSLRFTFLGSLSSWGQGRRRRLGTHCRHVQLTASRYARAIGQAGPKYVTV